MWKTHSNNIRIGSQPIGFAFLLAAIIRRAKTAIAIVATIGGCHDMSYTSSSSSTNNMSIGSHPDLDVVVIVVMAVVAAPAVLVAVVADVVVVVVVVFIM